MRRPGDGHSRVVGGDVPASPGRMEAFSDGVLAVAITLLVLDLRVPEPGGAAGLGHALVALWPHAVAYVVSLAAIGIMWINHHAMVHRLAAVDHSVHVLNLLLLMSIVVLPFTTALMSTYLVAPSGGHVAAAVYAGSLLVISAVFLALERHLLVRRPHLLREPLSRAQVRAILFRAGLAPPAYLVAGAAGLVTPYLTLAVCALLGTFYLLAPRSSGEAEARPTSPSTEG
ncbi:TMEM175 family protein [Ornithinimicrobium avium]|uniref:TMEM175 family protein n=1 Tax=Ornithinimicrobium avium TaxID=2283195 RepID=UPI0013B3C5A1|nr:TMEM175 family protein [Ornithinimicrobium avium]